MERELKLKSTGVVGLSLLLMNLAKEKEKEREGDKVVKVMKVNYEKFSLHKPVENK